MEMTILSEVELSGIADFLTNSNDLMSWEEQAAYLASEYEIESVEAKRIVEAFQDKFGTTTVILEDMAVIFLNEFQGKLMINP